MRTLKSILRTFGRWRRASFLKRRRFFWAVTQIIRIDLCLRWSGLVSARDSLLQRQPPEYLLSNSEPRELARIVNTAARFTIGRRESCLRRSLLLWWLLDSKGIACDLCVGMRSDGNTLKGHAWIELNGSPVNDRKDIRDQYHVLKFGDELSPRTSHTNGMWWRLLKGFPRD